MDLIPVFTTHHSISESILTADTDIFVKENEKKTSKVNLEASPISVLALAKHYGQKTLFVVDSDISAYWKLYKACKELGIQLIFGLKMTVCDDIADKEPTAEKTESNVIICFRNSQAYYDFVPLYSFASTVGKRQGRRVDWKNLNERWTDNFLLVLPFYSSFIARNLLVLDQKSYPDFRKMKPTFFIQNQGLPFDQFIEEAITKYCKAEKFQTLKAHQIYYYRDEDAMKLLTLKCIGRRTTWDKPNLDHFASNEFSYESYLRNTNQSL